MLLQVINELKNGAICCKGFVAEGKWTNNLRSGFSIKDLKTGKSYILCPENPGTGHEKIGRFYFNQKTIKIGEKILLDGKPGELMVIDEIGLFELKGKVWGKVLQTLLDQAQNPMLITVRQKFLKDVIDNFNIEIPLVFELQTEAKMIAATIERHLRDT